MKWICVKLLRTPFKFLAGRFSKCLRTRLSTSSMAGPPWPHSETVDDEKVDDLRPLQQRRAWRNTFICIREKQKAVCILSRYLDNWQFTFHFLRFPIKTDQFTESHSHFGRRHLVTLSDVSKRQKDNNKQPRRPRQPCRTLKRGQGTRVPPRPLFAAMPPPFWPLQSSHLAWELEAATSRQRIPIRFPTKWPFQV